MLQGFPYYQETQSEAWLLGLDEEDENNGFLKLWFLKTSEAPVNPILKIQ